MLSIAAARRQSSSLVDCGFPEYLGGLCLFGVLIVRVVLQAPGLQTRGVAPLQAKGAQAREHS